MKVQVSYGADLQDVPSITYSLTAEVADSLEMLASVLRDSEAELITEEYSLENLQLYARRAGTGQTDLARLSDRLTDCYKLIRGYYQIIETPPPETEPEPLPEVESEEPPAQASAPAREAEETEEEDV